MANFSLIGSNLDRFEIASYRSRTNLHRSYLTIHMSKCYEIFTVSYWQHEQCSCQISAQSDQILIDSKLSTNRSQNGPQFPKAGHVGPLTCQKRSPRILGEISASYTYK